MSRRNKKKRAGVSPDVPVVDAINELKEEVLEQARKVARNEIFTFYPLVEAAKELVALEATVKPPPVQAAEMEF